jgi:hypothetical protein
MKEIKAIKDFSLNGVPYVEGDIIKDLKIEEISRLNEKGFIEPLSYKELILIERELAKKKEELKDGINTK